MTGWRVFIESIFDDRLVIFRQIDQQRNDIGYTRFDKSESFLNSRYWFHSKSLNEIEKVSLRFTVYKPQSTKGWRFLTDSTYISSWRDIPEKFEHIKAFIAIEVYQISQRIARVLSFDTCVSSCFDQRSDALDGTNLHGLKCKENDLLLIYRIFMGEKFIQFATFSKRVIP